MLAPSQADDVPRAQTCGEAAEPRPIGNGALCIDTLHSLFTQAKSDGRTVSVPAGERWRAQRGRRGQITATSNRKMLAPSQADDVPRAQLSVTTALPKGEPRHRILAQEMERICIDTLHSLFYGYPSMRVPPESRMVVNGFRPGTLCLSLWERWPSAARTERANNGNVQSENAGTFAGR